MASENASSRRSDVVDDFSESAFNMVTSNSTEEWTTSDPSSISVK